MKAEQNENIVRGRCHFLQNDSQMPIKIWSFLLYLALNCWPRVRYEANQSKNSLEHSKKNSGTVLPIGHFQIALSLFIKVRLWAHSLLKTGSCKIFAQRAALIRRLTWEWPITA